MLNVSMYATATTDTHKGPHHVVQDTISTGLIQGLLSITLLFVVLGFVFGPRTGIVAKLITSVTSILALLVDENIY